MPEISRTNYPALILRIGLSIVILWFGANQLMNPDQWTSWVPEWVSMLSLTPERVVFFNGIFEIIAGALLLLGVYTRIVAAVLFLHMVVLVIEIGHSPTGLRDFGLATGFLALAVEKVHSWNLIDSTVRKAE